MISPTVGLRVYYLPKDDDFYFDSAKSLESRQPFDAGILYVWNNTCINVMVTNHRGEQRFISSCTLAQDREPQSGECYWMPYQQQAAKT